MIVIKSILTTLVCLTITAVCTQFNHTDRTGRYVMSYICVLYAMLCITMWMG